MVRSFVYIWVLKLFCATNFQAQSFDNFNDFSGVYSFDRSVKSSIGKEIRQLFNISDHIDYTPIQRHKYQSFYKGVKIQDGIININGEVISGGIYNFELDLDQSIIPVKEAYEQIVSSLDYPQVESLFLDQSELVVFIDKDDKRYRPILAHKIEVKSRNIGYNATVFVDATTANLLEERSNICHNDVAVLAKSLYNNNVILNVSREDTIYTMENHEVPVRTFDLDGRTQYATADLVSGPIDIFVNNSSAVQAHYTAQQTYRYYQYRHQRDSYDNLGGHLDSYINYDQDYTNAFWDGDKMVYGAGDNIRYAPVISLDVTGHEVTHGVIDHSADLIYSRESGALNESFADIFGEMIEYFATGSNDWILGRDVGLVEVLPLRSMIDPNSNDDPDTYGGIHWYDPNCERPVGSNDHCGVHNNSGVQNKWFYILAMGESGTNDLGDEYNVVGISRNAAAKIAYRNLTQYLWPSSMYIDARAGSIQAAIDLYGEGSQQVISTTNAWYAVGVGEAYIELDSIDEHSFDIYPNVQEVTSSSITLTWSADIPNDSLLFGVYLDKALIGITQDTLWTFEELQSETSYEVIIKVLKEDLVLSKSAAIDILTLSNENTGLDTIMSVFFEEGLEGWTSSGGDAKWYSGHRSPEGIGAILLRKEGAVHSEAFELSVGHHYGVSLSVYTWSMEFNEQLIVEQWINNNWVQIGSFSAMIDFYNYNVSRFNIPLLSTNESTQIRFSNHSSAMTDHVYIDEIIIHTEPSTETFSGRLNDILIWPNPTTQKLYYNYDLLKSDIEVIDHAGRLVKALKSGSHYGFIEVADLTEGTYFVLLYSEGQVHSQSFIKL